MAPSELAGHYALWRAFSRTGQTRVLPLRASGVTDGHLARGLDREQVRCLQKLLAMNRGAVPRTPRWESTAARSGEIRDVAMKCFAERGIARTSLRTIAAQAGVSLGLIQHYFVTKSQLIEAIDHYVLQVFAQMREAPPASADQVCGASDRLAALMTDNPDVMDYVGRALAEHDGVGNTIFDGFFAISADQGAAFAAQGLTPEDLDPLWSNMLPLILRVGTIMLRHHIERHTDGPLYDPEQLSRWNVAVTRMICRGQTN